MRPLYKGRILLTLTHTDDTTCLTTRFVCNKQMIEDFHMAAVIKIIMDVKDQFVRLLCQHFYDSLARLY